MSARRYARDSSNNGPIGIRARVAVEEFPDEDSQEISSVAPLRSQLALEYRLQSLCQRLLESYKDQLDWAAVSQVAQSLVTNSQRVSLLKERLLSGSYSSLTSPRRLQSISEQPSRDAAERSLFISQVDNQEAQETDAESTSGSESSSVGKAKEAAPYPPGTRAANSESGSSAIDYETASQRTTASEETEPETGTTGLGSSAENSIVQLSSSSTTPSPAHSSSNRSSSGGDSGCGAVLLDTPERQEPVPPKAVTPPPEPDISEEQSDTEAALPATAGEKGSEREEEDTSKSGEDSTGEAVSREEACGVMAEVADTNYVEMHLGGVVSKEEGGVEGRRGEGESGVWSGGEGGGSDTQRPLSERSNTGSGSDDGTEFSSTVMDQSTPARPHSNSCPLDDAPMDENTQESTTGGHRASLSLPSRSMSVSGSDSNLNTSFSTNTLEESRVHLAVALSMDKSASSDDLDASLPVSARISRRRQASIPNFVSKQTKGLRKSTRKLVKRMGSMKIGRGARRSLDSAGSTLPVMIPTPIRSQDWDPTFLLEELYSDYRRVVRSTTQEKARHCGYLQKLPVSQTKRTILKGYKRRYFRAIDGNLYYYEDRQSERALGFLKLEECKLSIIPEKLQLCLTESNGTSLVMRAPNHMELCEWHRALQLESLHPTTVTSGSTIEENPVIIVDIGASSVRVGIAGEDAYPEMFFPAVCSVDMTTEECNDCGLAALLPENRFGAKLIYPRRATAQMSRNSTVNNQAIVDLVDTVLNHYSLESYQCSLLMTVPPTVPEKERVELAEALLSTVFQFQSILLQEQALLSLYSYNTTAGVIVDIGDHIDIVPVIDGYPIDGAIKRLPFGGNAITENLKKLLTAKGIRYFSETETYINRFVKEDSCVVSLNYVEDCETCESQPARYSHQINVDRFQMPDHRKAIVLDDARFKATEGLFTPGLWGKDVTGLHDLVWESIQACPIDHRKLLLRSIYLSGGTSLLPGLQERLKMEISALAPTGTTVEVHASENRQHAAFLGAAILAGLTSFHQSVITQDEWNSKGPEALNKWSS